MWNLISASEALTFDDVTIVPGESDIRSRDGDLSWKLGKWTFDIPIISSNMTTTTGEKMAKKMAELGGLGVIHRFMSVEEQISITDNLRDSLSRTTVPVCHSVGSIVNDQLRIDTLIKNKKTDIICIDIAHGENTVHMQPTIRHVRSLGFRGPVIAGNVGSSMGAMRLIEMGADIVKVGIGPGSVCTTRIKTGVGVPQLSAIAENAFNIVPSKGPAFAVIGDGGIKYPGDVAKALAAGATAVMIGGMLAGTDCVPGWEDNDRPLLHAGNASSRVKEDFNQHNRNSEGVAKIVTRQPAGSTEKVIKEICEGVRSSMSYVGARNLREFYEKATFRRVTANAVIENHPHLQGENTR